MKSEDRLDSDLLCVIALRHFALMLHTHIQSARYSRWSSITKVLSAFEKDDGVLEAKWIGEDAAEAVLRGNVELAHALLGIMKTWYDGKHPKEEAEEPLETK